jgi:hypothetical protein
MPPGNAFTVGVLPAVLLVPLPPQALRAVNDNMTAMPLRLEKLDWGMIFLMNGLTVLNTPPEQAEC